MSADILGTGWDQCVSTVKSCFTSMETIRLVGTESPGQPPRLSHSSWAALIQHVIESADHKQSDKRSIKQYPQNHFHIYMYNKNIQMAHQQIKEMWVLREIKLISSHQTTLSPFLGTKFMPKLNDRHRDITQQRPQSPMVTHTWHASQYKVHKLH